jgi:abhydrolase domain-containing protein 13
MFIVSLLEFIMKIGFYLAFFLFLSLLMAYLMQNRMLYIPDAPNQAFRYPENNPKTYRHPGERSMPYEDVTVRTSDGFNLRGWFIK